jgi:hypothetical protein
MQCGSDKSSPRNTLRYIVRCFSRSDQFFGGAGLQVLYILILSCLETYLTLPELLSPSSTSLMVAFVRSHASASTCACGELCCEECIRHSCHNQCSQDLYGVNAVYYVDEMPKILAQLTEKPEQKAVLHVLYGLNTDSGNYSKPATFPASSPYHAAISVEACLTQMCLLILVHSFGCISSSSARSVVK